MNKTTALLLSLLLITGTSLSPAEALEEGEQTFSIDEVTFNLDWNDARFDWSQNTCLDLGAGENMPADCKGISIELEDEMHRNQPPSTNQILTQPAQ